MNMSDAPEECEIVVEFTVGEIKHRHRWASIYNQRLNESVSYWIQNCNDLILLQNKCWEIAKKVAKSE